MAHKLLMDTKAYLNKPTKEDARFIHRRMDRVELTLEEIIEHALAGYTFKSVVLTSTQKTSFESASLIVLDIDNGQTTNGIKVQTSNYSFNDVICHCESLQLPIAAIYSTHNSTHTWPRFRVIFQLDKIITDLNTMEKYYRAIHFYIPFADKRVKVCSLSYGGKDLLYLDNKRFLSTDYLNSLTKKYENQIVRTLDTQRLEDNLNNPFEKLDEFNLGFNKDKLSQLFNNDKKAAENQVLSRLCNQLESKDFVINKCFNTYAGARNALLQLPLDKLLGLYKNCHCIFHEDIHSSASVYQNKETGYYYYKCFSCKKHYDLFDLVALAYGYDKNRFYKAQKQLFYLLNITVEDEEWKLSEYEKLRFNRKILNHIESYKDEFPKTVKVLMRSQTILRVLIDTCEESLEHVSIKTNEEDALFQASRSYIAKICGLSHSVVKNRIEALLRAGIITVLDDKEVASYSEYYAKNSLLNKGHYTISTYYLHYLGYELLSNAEARLIAFNKSGATIKGESARQGLALNNNVRKKSKKILDQTINKTLLLWVQRTLQRKNCFLKKDYLSFAKKHGFSEEYASSFIVLIVQKFDLKKVILTKEIVSFYGLNLNDVRCVAFLKKE